MFTENEEIIGNVELNFAKPENVQEIVISAKGVLISLGKQPKTFLEVKETLWEAGLLDHDARMKSYNGATFLPPSFSANDFRSSITYEVALTVKGRHEFAQVSCFLNFNEDAWEVFRSFVIRGTAFSAYTVDVTCTLALAKPLCYTRGSAIPCVLALESADAQIAELLANAHAPAVQLCRHVEDAGTGLELRIARIWDALRPPSALASRASWSVIVGGAGDAAATAATRALESSLRGDLHSKILVGEIPLPETLTPSFSFDKMTLKARTEKGLSEKGFFCSFTQYEVQMLPLKTPGFVPEDSRKAVCFHIDVQIASAVAQDAHTSHFESRPRMPPGPSPHPHPRLPHRHSSHHCRHHHDRSTPNASPPRRTASARAAPVPASGSQTGRHCGGR
ncbi:hypothetical protein DFH11DRAFT_1541234 [Phellopilus nigrolimitatus]|nr:hypothetical protein DFH11DRAFT_1541234 [Phellopilus nigrolimitatus]